MIQLPTIVITNKADQGAPLGIIREWVGAIPEGWEQCGYVASSGRRFMNFELGQETTS